MSKKKGGAKKKKDGEDDFTGKFQRSYTRKCIMAGVPILRSLKDKFEEEEDIENVFLFFIFQVINHPLYSSMCGKKRDRWVSEP